MMETFLEENPLDSVFAEAWNLEHPDQFEDMLPKTDDEEDRTPFMMKFNLDELRGVDLDKMMNEAMDEYEAKQKAKEEGEASDDMLDENDNIKEEYVEKYTEEAKAYLRKHLKDEYMEMHTNHPDKDQFEKYGDSELETFIDEVEKRVFMDEEEAEKWMEEQYEKIDNKRQYPTRYPKLKINEDPIDQYFEEDKEPVQSLHEDEWVLTEENYHRWFSRINDRIGRYPSGFRHFESFANY